jgi:amidase
MGSRLLALLVVSIAVTSLPAPATHAARTLALDQATIADLNAAFAAGTLTSEQLIQRFLARVEAYDRKGPSIRAVMALNPRAIETARALDAERKAKGPRSPLHGIPVVLKDNIDTADLPTTGGSVLLEGSIPPDDAFIVKRLRDAGAIILAKVNLSEFASAAPLSSLGGQTLNPHDLTRTPSGSSGGTGAAIAAGYAVLGIGTDTGGSVRGPSTANGIVGLKPTLGLVSRDGIIPLALSFDTAGPMARSVHDVAAMLGVMAGVDPADATTTRGQGRASADYTTLLKVDALKGARIGVARDFMGADEEVDWVVDSALEAMRRAGATTIDVRYPRWVLDGKGEFYNAVRWPEFPVQIAQYLATTGPKFPKTLDELIDRARQFRSPQDGGAVPNNTRWALFVREQSSGSVEDPRYLAVRDHVLPAIRMVVEGLFAELKLDAIVYPTASRRPPQLAGPADPPNTPSATNIANLTGFPDLIVPAGFTSGALPVGISFFGPAFSEARLLALGYSFEQQTKARRLPRLTPPLPGEAVTVP